MKKVLISALMVFALISFIVPVGNLTGGNTITPANHGW
ncbi:hypothetical protein ACVWZB_004820 [Paenibacillus polymyxa]